MAVTTLGAFPGANSKDKSARIPAAISALNKALAGDQQAVTYMRQQAQNSATAVGKEAFKRALAIYDQQKPAAAPPSIATRVGGLVPIPKPLPTPAPVAKPDPLHDPFGPPDRSYGWRWDPTQTGGGQWKGTWVKMPATITDFGALPPDAGGMTVPVSQPKLVGFDTAHPPLTHPPSIRVRGMRPSQVKSVTVGSPDGGVITSTPAPEYSGPTPAVQAPADFGYVAPSAAPTVDSAASPPTVSPGNSKILLVLAAGVALWLMVEGKRK